ARAARHRRPASPGTDREPPARCRSAAAASSPSRGRVDGRTSRGRVWAWGTSLTRDLPLSGAGRSKSPARAIILYPLVSALGARGGAAVAQAPLSGWTGPSVGCYGERRTTRGPCVGRRHPTEPAHAPSGGRDRLPAGTRAGVRPRAGAVLHRAFADRAAVRRRVRHVRAD